MQLSTVRSNARSKLRRHAVSAVALALVGLIMLPSNALAAYGYNYGCDWSRGSFFGPTGFPSADIARSYQAQQGYTATSYPYTWASQVAANIPVIHAMHITTHGSAGQLIFYGEPTRYANGKSYNMSCLRSDTLADHSRLDGRYVHYATNDSGQTIVQDCNHMRWIQDGNGTPLKVAAIVCCKSAVAPTSTLKSVGRAFYEEGTNAALGFTLSISANNPYVSYDPAQDPTRVFSYWLWRYLGNDYCVGYASDVARDKVYQQFGSYLGYNGRYIYGNQAETL